MGVDIGFLPIGFGAIGVGDIGFLVMGFLAIGFLAIGFLPLILCPIILWSILPPIGLGMAVLAGLGLGVAAWAIPRGARATRQAAVRNLRMIFWVRAKAPDTENITSLTGALGWEIVQI